MSFLPTMQHRMSGRVAVFVPVPQEMMSTIIGTGGSNIKQIARDTRTRIKTCNGDNFGKGPGFLVNGIPSDCEEAQLAIRRGIENGPASIKEPVPQQFVRLLTKRNGSDNFRAIEEKCGVKITWPKINGTEQNVIFDIKGLISNCEHAREMLRENLKKWEVEGVGGKSVSPAGTNSKGGDDAMKLDVPKEYLPIVLGSGRANIERIETTTGTKIFVPPRKAQDGDVVQLKIIGQPKKCDEAKACIKHCIVFHKQKTLRNEFGGDKHFVCFAYENEKERFLLKPILDLNDFGQRYRIETAELDSDDDNDDDYTEREISEKTISDIEEHLRMPLENLKQLKEEKQLLADLWCHFGKVFVFCVDEEQIHDTFMPAEIKGRIIKMVSQTNPENQQIDGYWRASFKEGIDPDDITEGQLPKSGDEKHGFLGLKLVNTQWRYDVGYTTPTYRNVRLKVWQGLPGDSDEPPNEVKNILTPVPVFLQGIRGTGAWLCYPSISVLRGEIIIPNSRYDCRMKLRAGSRIVTDRDKICKEEDDILADYLSNCKLDLEKHCLRLPDEKEHEIPEGFDTIFYRESKEEMYEATLNDESFIIIVLNENEWDLGSSEKKIKKQFGIRVVMKSWSKALLSPEQHWKPEEILQNLKNYMTFLSLLQNYLFGEG